MYFDVNLLTVLSKKTQFNGVFSYKPRKDTTFRCKKSSHIFKTHHYKWLCRLTINSSNDWLIIRF